MPESKDIHTNKTQQVTFCIACKNPLEIGSKKCPHCGAHQNWKRFLENSSTVLALLIAIISVSTSSFAIYVNLIEKLQPKKPNIIVSFLSFREDFAQLYASNSGTVSGVIDQPWLLIKLSLKDNFVLQTASKFEISGDTTPYIKKDTGKLIKIRADDASINPVKTPILLFWGSSSTLSKIEPECKISYHVISLEGERERKFVSCDYAQLIGSNVQLSKTEVIRFFDNNGNRVELSDLTDDARKQALSILTYRKKQ